MKVLLDGLLPRLFPELSFLCISHDGKNDLQKSISRKLRAWREPGVQFVIAQDQDGSDCRELKDKLIKLAEDGGRKDAVVRIICHELEAWYFGAPAALAGAYSLPNLPATLAKARFRDPDRIVEPSKAIVELVEEFQKVSGARRMAPALGRESQSRSYQVFLEGVERLIAAAPAVA